MSVRTRVLFFGALVFSWINDACSKSKMITIGHPKAIQLAIGIRPEQGGDLYRPKLDKNNFVSFYLLNLGISLNTNSGVRFWLGPKRLWLKKAAPVVLAAAVLMLSPQAYAQSWDSDNDGRNASAIVSNRGEEGFVFTCDTTQRFAEPYYTFWVGGGGGGIGTEGDVLPADFVIDGRTVDAYLTVERQGGVLVYTMRADNLAAMSNMDVINDRLRAGRRLTVVIPSLGLRESFPLDGADDAIRSVLEVCR